MPASVPDKLFMYRCNPFALSLFSLNLLSLRSAVVLARMIVSSCHSIAALRASTASSSSINSRSSWNYFDSERYNDIALEWIIGNVVNILMKDKCEKQGWTLISEQFCMSGEKSCNNCANCIRFQHSQLQGSQGYKVKVEGRIGLM